MFKNLFKHKPSEVKQMPKSADLLAICDICHDPFLIGPATNELLFMVIRGEISTCVVCIAREKRFIEQIEAQVAE